MLRIFLFLSIFSNLFSNDFRDIHKISLKKDEEIKIYVKYANRNKLFKFRWTLYKNGGLVIHRRYDGVVGQNILYLNHTNQSFRVALKPSGLQVFNLPYLLVKFKEFKKNMAKFEIYLKDDNEEINLKYPKKGLKK